MRQHGWLHASPQPPGRSEASASRHGGTERDAAGTSRTTSCLPSVMQSRLEDALAVFVVAGDRSHGTCDHSTASLTLRSVSGSSTVRALRARAVTLDVKSRPIERSSTSSRFGNGVDRGIDPPRWRFQSAESRSGVRCSSRMASTSISRSSEVAVGRHLGRLEEPSTASAAAWAAAGAAARMLHASPLPPWPGRSLSELAWRLESECHWLVANNVLPTEVVRATAGSPKPRSGRGHRCSSTATCRSPTSDSESTITWSSRRCVAEVRGFPGRPCSTDCHGLDVIARRERLGARRRDSSSSSSTSPRSGSARGWSWRKRGGRPPVEHRLLHRAHARAPVTNAGNKVVRVGDDPREVAAASSGRGHQRLSWAGMRSKACGLGTASFKPLWMRCRL